MTNLVKNFDFGKLNYYKDFKIELQTFRELLGTNPRMPDIREKHLIQKSNELIMKFNKTKSQVNARFVDNEPISDATAMKELEEHLLTLEAFFGFHFTDEDKQALLTDSKAFFKQHGDDGSSVTCFFVDPVTKLPYLKGYMMRGFLKSASDAIFRIRGKKEKVAGEDKTAKWMDSLTSNVSYITKFIAVSDRIICDTDMMREDGKAKTLVRPMRGSNNLVSIAASEVIPAGAKLTFYITLMGNLITPDDIIEMLYYGQKMGGIGQNRNGGYGKFTITTVEEVKLSQEDKIKHGLLG